MRTTNNSVYTIETDFTTCSKGTDSEKAELMVTFCEKKRHPLVISGKLTVKGNTYFIKANTEFNGLLISDEFFIGRSELQPCLSQQLEREQPSLLLEIKERCAQAVANAMLTSYEMECDGLLANNKASLKKQTKTKKEVVPESYNKEILIELTDPVKETQKTKNNTKQEKIAYENLRQQIEELQKSASELEKYLDGLIQRKQTISGTKNKEFTSFFSKISLFFKSCDEGRSFKTIRNTQFTTQLIREAEALSQAISELKIKYEDRLPEKKKPEIAKTVLEETAETVVEETAETVTEEPAPEPTTTVSTLPQAQVVPRPVAPIDDYDNPPPATTHYALVGAEQRFFAASPTTETRNTTNGVFNSKMGYRRNPYADLSKDTPDITVKTLFIPFGNRTGI